MLDRARSLSGMLIWLVLVVGTAGLALGALKAQASPLDTSDPRVLRCQEQVGAFYFDLIRAVNSGRTAPQAAENSLGLLRPRGYDPHLVKAFIFAFYDKNQTDMRDEAHALIMECVRVGEGG